MDAWGFLLLGFVPYLLTIYTRAATRLLPPSSLSSQPAPKLNPHPLTPRPPSKSSHKRLAYAYWYAYDPPPIFRRRLATPNHQQLARNCAQ
ncbi:hypothetical protein VHEMI07736 [[Torrubiella] hemipterigena]|uniref:Uncharacterized protein n=1 Tax=[Torrubiella] hemipterigena TaxID=1531966 RepID=A0A0A1TM65_9HYPO|nr:hypothetical protein VHEMI07736 [[Torrubiella] hemipterigena]